MAETVAQRAKRIGGTPICTWLDLRDALDGVLVRLDGSYVAGYRVRGAMTYFASDPERNELKARLDALYRTCPEESMRMQIRYEINDHIGSLIEDYEDARRTEHPEAIALDEERVMGWRARAAEGEFLSRTLTLYFIWSPEKHRKMMAASGIPLGGGKQRQSFSLGSKGNIRCAKAEHEAKLAQFNSLLRGIESSMSAADFAPERMNETEILEAVQATVSPFNPIKVKLRAQPLSTRYISVRERILNSLLYQSENYSAIDNLLWGVVTFKEFPEQTWPGIMRDLQVLGFPLVISANIEIPSQTEVLETFKNRHKKMLAVQVNHRGEFRLDMAAQVAADELAEIQARIMGSSTRLCEMSISIAFRTSRPFRNDAELELAKQEIAIRREQILHVVSRMDGASAMPETMHALTRLLFNTMPGMADQDLRNKPVLSATAADLSPVEMPWVGTPKSPMMLMETPYRQLVPFSPFDPSLDNANALITATSGSGKSMLVQKMLLSAGRMDVKVSILERGDSYLNTVRYMGGKMITMSLDSTQTINPFDFAPGETELTNDHRSFLINLIKHMVGDSPNSDPDILHNVIEGSIRSSYQRSKVRSVKIPTLSDVCDELRNYFDKSREESVLREAHIAAVKLRSWVDDGIYASLFDRQTTVDMDSPWLYFNIEKLRDDPRLETAMSLMIAYTTSRRAEGRQGARCLTVLDECWAMNKIPVLAEVVEGLFRTARKRNACVWAVSQAVEDFTGTPDAPNLIGGAILATTAVRLIGRQKGNVDVLYEFLHLTTPAVEHVKNIPMTEKGKRSEFQVSTGESSANIHSFIVHLTPTEYWLATSYPRERQFRTWWLYTHQNMSFPEAIRSLATKYSVGLADLPELPEERSGEVTRATSLPETELVEVVPDGHRGKRVGNRSLPAVRIFPELSPTSEVGL